MNRPDPIPVPDVIKDNSTSQQSVRVCQQYERNNYGQPPELFYPSRTSCLSRSSKPDRSATYDFLLVIHSTDLQACVILFPRWTAILVEIHKFSHTRAFNAHAEGFPLEFCKNCNGGGSEKNYGRPNNRTKRRKSLMICAFVWIQYHNVTARRTDKYCKTWRCACWRTINKKLGYRWQTARRV